MAARHALVNNLGRGARGATKENSGRFRARLAGINWQYAEALHRTRQRFASAWEGGGEELSSDCRKSE
jgi:hypothetical protein